MGLNRTKLISNLPNLDALLGFCWLFALMTALLGYGLRSRPDHWYASRGETLLRRALVDHLPPESWHLLNNATLNIEESTTQIDHVLVSRSGLLVREKKHYIRRIFGDAKSKQWTQVIFKRKHRIQNPLHQNYQHAMADQALMNFLPPDQIIGLVVFTSDAKFKAIGPSGVYSLEELALTNRPL